MPNAKWVPNFSKHGEKREESSRKKREGKFFALFQEFQTYDSLVYNISAKALQSSVYYNIKFVDDWRLEADSS